MSEDTNEAQNYSVYLEQIRYLANTEITTDKLNLPSSTINVVLAFYCILIIGGSIENILVIGAVMCRPNLRNARNLLIVNLAVSDLWQCLVTMPLTFTEIKYSFWPWQTAPLLCKMFPLFGSVSVFVSTLSITAITIDRMWLICYSHKTSLKFNQILILMPFLWMIAFCMSYPQMHWKELVTKTVNEYVAMETSFPTQDWIGFYGSINSSKQMQNLDLTAFNNSCQFHEFPYTLNNQSLCLQMKVQMANTINFSDNNISMCTEEFPPLYRFLYSLFTMVFQYLVPGLAIASANSKIYKELRKRKRQSVRIKSNDSSRLHEEKQKIMRASKLLFSIIIVFLICWIPLNALNLLSDWLYLEDKSILAIVGDKPFYLIYSCCHLSAMSCTVINPILYGFFNENFRRELDDVFQMITSKLHFKRIAGEELPLSSDVNRAEGEKQISNRRKSIVQGEKV